MGVDSDGGNGTSSGTEGGGTEGGAPGAGRWRRRRRRVAAVVTAGALAFAASALPAAAQEEPAAGVAASEADGTVWRHTDTLLPPQPRAGSLFGGYRGGVAAQGDVVVAAAADYLNGGAGSVEVFERTPLGWRHETLTSPAPVPAGQFGRAVALDGDALAIGAWTEGNGAVHVYRRQVGRAPGEPLFVHEATLTCDGGCSEFGIDVDVAGDTLVVGSRWADRADVFVRAAGGSWARTAVLRAPDPGDLSNFGTAVAIGDDGTGGAWIAVGDYHHNHDGDPADEGAGAAFLFQGSGATWTLRDEVQAPEPTGNARFGASLDIGGSRLAVGAPRTGYPLQRGAAYVFDVDPVAGTATLAATLAPDEVGPAYFGADVAIGGGELVVGAPQAEIGYPTGGPGFVAVYREAGGTWSRMARIQAPDGIVGDGFGEGVAFVPGFQVAVGAPYRLGNRGALYRFRSAPVGEVAPRVHLVVGDAARPARYDRVLAQRLRANHWDVRIVDDSAPAGSLAGVARVIISSSVNPTQVGSRYRSATVPVVVMEPFLFDDMGFTRDLGAERGETTATFVDVDDVNPMNGNYDAVPSQVFATPQRLAFGRPGGEPRIWATVPGRADLAVMFGYERNALMAGARRPPAIRIAVFPSYAGMGALTGTVWGTSWWSDQQWFVDGGWGRLDAAFQCANDRLDIVRWWECWADFGTGPPT